VAYQALIQGWPEDANGHDWHPAHRPGKVQLSSVRAAAVQRVEEPSISLFGDIAIIGFFLLKPSWNHAKAFEKIPANLSYQ
jgi:hypothetical protein